MKNYVYNGIMGLVVGDALGVPVEFKERDTYEVTDMIGWGTYNQPPGTWSDDSSMTLATLESLGREQWFDLVDIMTNFVSWLYHGDFTPYGEVFDVGRTTHKAIRNFDAGDSVYSCGCRMASDNGNGSLMRILPLAFVNEIEVEDIYEVSSLTHAHEISQIACLYYVAIARELISGTEKEKAILDRIIAVESEVDVPEIFCRLKDLKHIPREQIASTGYVVRTLEAALWCFLNSENYKECVLKAVNLGGDTDTIAAVAGGLAGIYYGVGGKKGIPEEWIDQIPKKEWIKELCERI